MEPGRRKCYVRVSHLYEVDLSRSDDYLTVVQKIFQAIPSDETVSTNFVLCTSRGSVICDEPLLVKGTNVSWTLGAYLCKRHASPDKITLGLMEKEDGKTAAQKKTRIDDSTSSVSNRMCLKEASEKDTIKGTSSFCCYCLISLA